MVTIERDWVIVLTSGTFGALVSAIIGAWQWYLKYKDDRAKDDENKKKSDVEFYRKKWLEDEDEIDHLRDDNRKLKDKIYFLRQEIKNKNE